MGTQLQEVYDAFFVKTPDTDFTGKEELVYQFFKASIGYCYKTVPESLTYTLTNQTTYDGQFNDTLGLDSIELLALCMARELYRRYDEKYNNIKQYVGTQAFNKLPDIPDLAEKSKERLTTLSDEIYKFRQEFYTYEN